MRILIAETRPHIGRLMRTWLVDCGYAVCLVNDGASVLAALREQDYEMVLLAGAIAVQGGVGLFAFWRRAGYAKPILVLDDGALSDRAGSCAFDLVLSRPQSAEDLTCQVGTMIRHYSAARDAVLEHRGIRLDVERRTAITGGKVVMLSRYEYAMLELFMRNVGKTVPSAVMAKQLWNADHDTKRNNLATYMVKLRAKFETSANQPLFKNFPGIGYRLL